jgi:hypothetical protein
MKKRGTTSDDGLYGAASLALFVRSGIIRTLWCQFSYLYCVIWHHTVSMVSLLLSLLCDLASYGLYGSLLLSLLSDLASYGLYGVTFLIFIVRSGIIRSLWCHFSYLYCVIWHHRALMVPLPFFM